MRPVYRELRKLELPAKIDTQCQGTKSLCDSGEAWLVLSVIPREEIVGSGGSPCLED